MHRKGLGINILSSFSGNSDEGSWKINLKKHCLTFCLLSSIYLELPSHTTQAFYVSWLVHLRHLHPFSPCLCLSLTSSYPCTGLFVVFSLSKNPKVPPLTTWKVWTSLLSIQNPKKWKPPICPSLCPLFIQYRHCSSSYGSLLSPTFKKRLIPMYPLPVNLASRSSRPAWHPTPLIHLLVNLGVSSRF